MLQKVFAKMEGLEIVWKGTTKKKDGKEVPACQAMVKSPQGHVQTMYLGGNGVVTPLKLGDVIDAEVAIRAYGNALYLDLISTKPHFIAKGAGK